MIRSTSRVSARVVTLSRPDWNCGLSIHGSIEAARVLRRTALTGRFESGLVTVHRELLSCRKNRLPTSARWLNWSR